MKYNTPLIPLLVCFGILFLSYRYLTDGYLAIHTSAAKADAEQRNVIQLKSELTTAKSKTATLRSETQVYEAFVVEWSDVYRKNHLTQKLVERINIDSEKRGVTILEDKPDDGIKLRIGSIETRAIKHTLKVSAGDYASLLAFLGDLETDLEMAQVQSVRITSGMQGVGMQLEVVVPSFSF